MLKPLTGALLAGRYRVAEPLGHGGMGDVYAAVDETLRRAVAIKVLRAGASGDRFKREALLVSRLAHPNIVAISDYHDDPGEPAFIALERLHGESLRALLERVEVVEAKRLARLAIQTLSALAAAHDAQIVHRDVKPDNIFLCRTEAGEDLVKLLDFGIARPLDSATIDALTRSGALLGTVAYMAPEQVLGTRVDARTDIYGVGAVMYHALAGHVPFRGTTTEVLTAIATQPLPPLQGVDPELAGIVARAMSRDPNARFGRAREMSSALTRYLEASRRYSAKSLVIGAIIASLAATALVTAAVLWRHHTRTTAKSAAAVASVAPQRVAATAIEPEGDASVAAPVESASAVASSATATTTHTTQSSAKRRANAIRVSVTSNPSSADTRKRQQIAALFVAHLSNFRECYLNAFGDSDAPPEGNLRGVVAVIDRGRTIRDANVTIRGPFHKPARQDVELSRCIESVLRSFDYSKVDDMSSTSELMDYELTFASERTH